MRGSLRLLLSAVFVGANFAASFLVVVLIARAADPLAREVFFTFQAIFFATVMLASQTAILQGYRGLSDTGAERLTEIGIFATVIAGLVLLSGERVGGWELLAYGAATVASARAAAVMAGLQFSMRRPGEIMAPILAAVLRCAVAWGLIGFGPAMAFFGAAVAHLATGLVARVLLGRPDDAGKLQADPARPRGGHWEMFAFTAATAIAFQWDRMLLSARDLGDVVVTAGVIATWVLPPVSLLFATVYRARAAEIFAEVPPRAEARRVFLRQGGLFAGLSLLWLIVLLLAWRPLNALAFPFADAPVWLAMLLGVALIADRLGNLAAFLCGEGFGRRAVVKGGLVALAVLIASLAIPDGLAALSAIYVLFALQAGGWLAVGLFLLFGRRASGVAGSD